MMIRLLALLALSFQAASPVLTMQDVTFPGAGVTLAGTVVAPAESPGTRKPGVVLLAGSGPGPRAALMPYANQLASLGVIALAFDKRGSGQSQGDWTDASLDDLADDATAAMRWLAARPDVDAARVGVWGVSQAGWVIPLLATRSPKPAFAIIVTGGGATPKEIELFGYRQQFEKSGVAPADRVKAEALLSDYFAWLGSGVGRAGLVAELERAKAEPWYRFVPLDRILPSDASRPNWAWVANFDPAGSIRQMQMPTIVLLGAGDPLGPADLSANRWNDAIAAGGNKKAAVRVIDDMGHAARQGEGHNASNPLSPGYLAAVEDFIRAYVTKK